MPNARRPDACSRHPGSPVEGNLSLLLLGDNTMARAESEVISLSFAKTSSHLVDNGRRSRDRRGNARRLQTTARERAAWAHPDPLQKEEELGVGRQSSRTEGRAYEPIGLDQAARRT